MPVLATVRRLQGLAVAAFEMNDSRLVAVIGGFGTFQWRPVGEPRFGGASSRTASPIPTVGSVRHDFRHQSHRCHS